MQDGKGNADGSGLSKRVLIIAYYWPPAGGPGVQRWLKFAKYLPDNGWEPTMLVPDGAAYPVLDPSLASDVPKTLDVHRIPIFEPYEAAMRMFRGRKKAERLGSVSSGRTKPGLTQRLMLWLRGNLLLPDPRVLWRRKARSAATELLRRAEAEGRPYRAVITTGPPHSVHLIGLDLKRTSGLPWISDFRDPWREMDYLKDFMPTARTHRRHLHLEGLVVESSDMLLMTSKGIRTSFSVHPGAADKLTLIPNGWDETDVSETDPTAAPPDPHRKSWDFGHFGSLFPIRNAPGLWKAMARWNAQGRLPIHLHCYGVVNPEVTAALNEHLPGQWTDHGYVPHREAVAAMQKMDALLILQNRSESGRFAIPGKAFEYLAMGKPMAVVTPAPSDLSDLMSEWGFQTIGYDDQDEAEALLDSLYTHAGPDPGLRHAYKRSNLTRKLAQALDQLTTAAAT